MIAKTSDNIDQFIDCDVLYDIRTITGFSTEKEVLALGTVKVACVIWANNVSELKSLFRSKFSGDNEEEE